MFDVISLFNVSNAITAILFCTVFWIVFQLQRPPKGFPPGKDGLPFIGTLFSVGPHFERYLAKQRKEYGPISYVKMGSSRIVVLNTFDAIYEGFVKQGHTLSGRWTPEVLKEGNDCEYGLALIDYSNRWKEQRKFALSTLTFFGLGKRSIEPKIVLEADALCEVLQSKAPEFEKTGFHPGSYFALASLNVINALSYSDLSSDATKELSRKLIDVTTEPTDRVKAEQLFMFLMIFPQFRRFPGIKQIRDEHQNTTQERIQLAKHYVDIHKETYDPEHCRDFVDAFLKEMEIKEKECPGSHYFEERQLQLFLVDLFLAGTDTTATTVYWALVFLSAYPECQEKIQEEIESVLGSDGTPKYENRHQLPYVQAVIQETFRMRPVFPISITHKASEDMDLLGYRIPKDTPVCANLWGVQNDPGVWDNPDEFRPERHINKKGEFVKSDRVIPFSIGLRFCLGKHLAQMSVFTFIVRLTQRFAFSFPKDQPTPDLKGTTLFVLSPIGIRLNYTAR